MVVDGRDRLRQRKCLSLLSVCSCPRTKAGVAGNTLPFCFQSKRYQSLPSSKSETPVECLAIEARKGPHVRALSLVKRTSALLVATSNATGHHRSIRSMNPGDFYRAVATCIRSAKLESNARTMVTTPVVVTPFAVTVTMTPAVVLSGRWHRHRKQRQRC